MTTEQEQTLKALEIAIQMEIDGKECYLQSSKETADEIGRKLFMQLAEEEDIHRKKFEEIYKSLESRNSWPSVTYHPDSGQALRTIFAEGIVGECNVDSTSDTEIAAVEKAAAMENKTYDFYIKQTKAATYEAEKSFYKALAAQEKEHNLILMDYYQFLKDPESWFTEKEHHSLDGG